MRDFGMTSRATLLGTRLLFGLALALGTGCGVFDRESYSIIIRKPAHQYHELTEVEKEEIALYEPTRVASSDGFVASVAYEPFSPFRYCHRHASYHVTESLASIVFAPVEYPAAVGGDLGGVLVRGSFAFVGGLGELMASGATWMWERVFPPREEPELPQPPIERASSR
jgi:hypothetical protein